MRSQSGRFTIILCIFAVLGSSAYALTAESVDAYGGVLWIGNGAGTVDAPVGAPSPLLTTYSVTVPLRVSRFFLFVPGIDVFGTRYGFEPGSTKAVPVEIEYASGVWELGLVISPAVAFDLPLRGGSHLGVFAGTSFVLRAPIVVWPETATDLRGQVAQYHYGAGRFFYPEAGLYFQWLAFDNLSVALRGKVLFPLFHAWDGESVPFYDQLMVSGAVGFRFLLPSE